ncbi:hypothetical protein L596_027319 [Steinernema carpocapsae]|uniref:UPAR/Ly6 domain-containing protein n=1 Tax=Steinernema carpocapsae TaxID=34508 RepID=A0A4V5ZYF6_STECR|nr:hypothetical protein L596_027319 [Steinernema carpocapsae]
MSGGLLACTFMAILSVISAIKCYSGSYYDEYYSRPVGKTECTDAKFCFRQSGPHDARIGWLHGCGPDVCTEVVTNITIRYVEDNWSRDCCDTDFCNAPLTGEFERGQEDPASMLSERKSNSVERFFSFLSSAFAVAFVLLFH